MENILLLGIFTVACLIGGVVAWREAKSIPNRLVAVFLFIGGGAFFGYQLLTLLRA